MSDTNRKLDQHIRRQAIRKALPFVLMAVAFAAFMTYALYVEYGPDAEVVDLFPEVNGKDKQP